MTHTPGPWKPVRSLTCGHLRAEHNYKQDPQKEWTDADMRLIAAAPEMLEACKDTMRFLERYADPDSNVLWGTVSAVIRKAEGINE